MDMMMHVPGTLWHKLGTTFTEPVKTSNQIASNSNMDYTISAHSMGCDILSPVKGYHAIFRDDCNQLLGVVNTPYVQIVQNVDSFKIMEPLISRDLVTPETASVYKSGESVFCVFPLNTKYKLVDDDIQHYFIVVNNHLKPDGKVLVINTPVRVVCQNALSYALSKSIYSARILVLDTAQSMDYLAKQLVESADEAINYLNKQADRMLKKKVTAQGLDNFLDVILPFVQVDDSISTHDKANDTIDLMRATLTECIHADDLSNYTGTVYQVYNGLADFIQHYHKDGTKGFDLNYKISLIPGIGTTDPKVGWMKSLLSMSSELAA